MKHLLIGLLLLVSLAGNALAIEQPNMPTAFDIIMLAGADYSLSVRITDNSGNPYSMEQNQYAAQFRSAPAPTGALFANFSTVIRQSVFNRYSSGIEIPALGPPMLAIKLSKAQTQKLSGKTGLWDLKQTDLNGLVSYIIFGKVAVRPMVTQ